MFVLSPHILNFFSIFQDQGFTPQYYDIEFRSLQYALFVACFFQAFGSYFFLLTSFYVLDDKANAEEEVRRQLQQQPQEADAAASGSILARVPLASSDRDPIVRNMDQEEEQGSGTEDQAAES